MRKVSANMRDTSYQTPVSGVIQADSLYTLEEFKKRLQVKDATLRAARRAGLQIRYLHGRAFIIGRDWIEYVCAAGAH
jgi:hypothetical protein